MFPLKFSLAVAGSSGQKEEFWLLKKPRGSNDDDEDDENDDNDDVDIMIMMMMMMHQVHSPTNCWDQKKFSSCIGKPLRPFYSNKKPSQPWKKVISFLTRDYATKVLSWNFCLFCDASTVWLAQYFALSGTPPDDDDDDDNEEWGGMTQYLASMYVAKNFWGCIKPKYLILLQPQSRHGFFSNKVS